MRAPVFSRTIAVFVALVAGAGSCAFSQFASLQSTLSLQHVDGIAVPYQNGIVVPSFEKQKRPMLSLAGTWKKLRFSADHNLTLKRRDEAGYAQLIAEAGNRFSRGYDDGAWQGSVIPGIENALNGYQKTPEYYENGVWYRTKFAVSDSMRGRIAQLRFLAVNYVADVWLNGTYLGWHEGGYTPFAFDVSSVLRYDSLNVLAVRVDNVPWSQGQVQDLPTGKRIDIVPYYKVDWFNYTGIFHDVYLEFSSQLSVPRVNVVPTDVDGTLTTTIVVRNEGTAEETADVSIEVFRAAVDSSNINSEFSSDLIGSAVGLGGVTRTSLAVGKDTCRIWQTVVHVASPKLWTPRDPNLYVMKVTLRRGTTVVDEFSTQFGIRTLSSSGSTFLLNGKPTFLPGIARHEDHPSYGRSMPRAVILDDLRKIKSLNVALLRTAHYPNNPHTYLLCDRLGLAVMEEIPVWWFDTDDAWLIQNIARNIHTQMFREMVFKDYNRPSVFLWSTCNECLIVPGRETFIRNVNSELKNEYPDGRFVSQSAAADRPGANDASQLVCDAAGWTMYFGIFHGSTYYAGTKQFLRNAHTALPAKPVLNTEFGIWSSVSEDQQLEVFDSTFAAFSEVTVVDASGTINPNGFLMGCTWWTAFDWYTSQQPTYYQRMGVYEMDRAKTKKTAAKMASVYDSYYRNIAVTDVQEEAAGALPVNFTLSESYPNPFSAGRESTRGAASVTSIQYQIGGRVEDAGAVSPASARSALSPVTLKIFDILGREVVTLVDHSLGAGSYSAQWNGRNKYGNAVPAGVYFYQLRAGSDVLTKKMVVVK